ncbi:outer membrane beta-barrel protein [Ferruginibacter paludis]|uniref:outer membrane beta-barrel protein n=1 Tax=Ferruginibacter paludis TaxID=1310417 RepID=UPI0025B4E8D9|nr:outer membrane beta-barrel protein [Ferruginibacter paludis]MDN3659161.1 outer membrane beta-barrel protein [Ferruginibacter paludis]
MKVISSFICFLFITTILFAQTTGVTLAGTVTDTKHEAISSATIRLVNAKDSTIIKETLTNDNGKFRLNGISEGAYRLIVTAVGQMQFVPVLFTVDSSRQDMLLPPVVMVPAKNTDLTGVTVTARRPLIEQQIDKTVVHVDAMISSATSNTLEVLEKTPGITIGVNNGINLNGRGALVLIDGRQTYMSGQDLAAYLKSLPGSVLDKIELMDNPPARYDAAGNAIINIRLKKNRMAGFTGNISMGYSQGRYVRLNDAVNLNYNRKKLNLFANIGFNKEQNYTNDLFDRKFYTADGALSSVLSLSNNQQYKTQGANINLGLDYAITQKTTYGVVLNFNGGKRNGWFSAAGKNYNKNDQLMGISAGNNTGGDNRSNGSINLSVVHKLNDNGRELSGDINYLHYKTDGNQLLENFIFQPDGTLNEASKFQYLAPSSFNIYSAKTDYVHPLKNKAKVEAGIKSSIVDNDNVVNYFDRMTEIPVIDYSRSNHFKYHENINALYVNGQKNWQRWGMQSGLRIENTNLRGNQLGNGVAGDSSFSKNYTGVFPSLYFSYKLDSIGNNTLNLLAVKRINRPNYQLLNPFVFFRDQYSYTAGNPMLNPQYQYRLELKYTHKQLFRTALSFNRFTNVIFQTTQAIDSIFITRPQNIARGYMILLNSGLSLTPAKWWNLNLDILLSHMGLNGKAYTENLVTNVYVARINLLNQLRFNNGWSADFGGYYASRDLNGQAITSGMVRVNAAVQKKIWKDKASIRVAFDDIFHSWIYHNKSLGVKQAQYFQTTETDTQRMGLGFTWRFGKSTFARKSKHNDNASDEEKGRVE